MKISFIIYNKITLLDFIGLYDLILSLKTMNFIEDISWDICTYTNEVQDIGGGRVVPNKVKNDLLIIVLNLILIFYIIMGDYNGL